MIAVDGVEQTGLVETLNGVGLSNNDDDELIEQSIDPSLMCLLAEGQNSAVEFDFGDSYNLASILLWNYNDKFNLEHGIKSADISIWNEQDGWKKIYDDHQFDQAEGTDDYDEPVLITLNTTTQAQKVRLDNLVSFSGTEKVGLSAIQFFEELGPAAVKPAPAHGETIGAGNSVALKWTAGLGAQVHHVYAGTDEGNLELLGKTSSSSAVLENLQPDTAYYWRIDETASDGAITAGQLWKFTVAEAKMLGWWKFDELEGDAVVDSSGNELNSKVCGQPVLTDGKYGSSLKLDGTDDYAEAQISSLNTNTITITAWIRREGTQQVWSGIAVWNDRENSRWYGICLGDNNDLRYCWQDMPQTWDWNSGFVVPDDQWVFVALTVEPKQAALYMYDGSMHSAVNNLDHPKEVFNEVVNMGLTFSYSLQKDMLFKGSIDDVRIYDFSMSKSQIEQLVRDPSGQLPRTIGKLSLKETAEPEPKIPQEPAETKQAKRSNNLLPVFVIVAVVVVIIVILGLGKK